MTDDGFNLNATQLTYLSQYIMLRQEKVNAQNISKNNLDPILRSKN